MIHPVPKPKKKRKTRRKMLRKFSIIKRPAPSYAAAAVPKGERIKDPEHLDRVRAMHCACWGGAMGSRIDESIGRGCGGWRPVAHGGTAQIGDWVVESISEAAHVTNRGWGGGDNEVIPLCPNHHRLLACSWHVAGRKRFEAMFGINAAQLALALYDETLRLRGKGTP